MYIKVVLNYAINTGQENDWKTRVHQGSLATKREWGLVFLSLFLAKKKELFIAASLTWLVNRTFRVTHRRSTFNDIAK